MQNKRYNYIFLLFRTVGIFQLGKNQRSGKSLHFICSNLSNIIFNSILIIVPFILYVSYILHWPGINPQKQIVYLSTFFVYAINRIYIIMNVGEFFLLSKKVNNMLRTFKQTSKLPLMLIIWWFYIILLNILMSVITFENFKCDETIQLFLFGKKDNSYVFSVACRLIYTIFSCIYLYMPITIFSMFYVSMCFDIKNIILRFQNVMKDTYNSDFNYLCNFYNDIRDLVKLFDKQVGILVFISFLVNSLIIFIMVSVSSQLTENAYFRIEFSLRGFLIPLHFLAIVLNFFVQMLYASFVYDASLTVREKSRNMKENNLEVIYDYLRFLRNSEEEICLTLFGIASIKRSFVFGTFGTIITYSFLFGSL